MSAAATSRDPATLKAVLHSVRRTLSAREVSKGRCPGRRPPGLTRFARATAMTTSIEDGSTAVSLAAPGITL